MTGPFTPWTPESHPYGAFLHRVQKPSRYLGGEYRSVDKSWEETPWRVALAFPDLYEIGMSHLGLRILYSLLNADRRIAAERVFAPWKDLERELRDRSIPLVSLETAKPIAEFDIVGFSLQYELTFTNVLNMLDLAGLPLRSEERNEGHPLIVAGGPLAVQPEPLAPFIDAFVVGDGEYYFPRLIEHAMGWRRGGLSRTETLVRLAGLGGIYCPSLYKTSVEPATGQVVVGEPKHASVPRKVKRQVVTDLNAYPFPAESPVSSTEIIFDRFAMEIARGCTEGCRFCQAGMIYRPVRERKPAEIVDALMEAVRGGGYDDVSLTALSTADFSCISPLVPQLMERLRGEKVSLNVSSLRAYGLPDELLDSIAEVRNTNLTFAPEAGSQRLRDVINKNVSDDDMEATAHSVFSRGWRRCKLYFMIGLPTETDEDVRGILRTARRYLEIGRDHVGRGRCQVTASVSTYVPKPHTPFQWVPMNDLGEITRKQALLQAQAKKEGVRLKWHDAQTSVIEGILARGDRRVADLVEYAFRAGCRFDGWDDELRFDVWEQGLEELRLCRETYFAGLPLGGRLPWDHIDVGVAPAFLQREYERSVGGRSSPPCGKPFGAKVHASCLEDAERDTRKLVCFQCGVECDLEAMREGRRQSLQALATHAPDAEARIEAPEATDVKASTSRRARPRTAIRNRESLRYRLLFTKKERARYLSHLDVVRTIPRVFRRASLPMTYSLGFHPKPRLTFSPALRLGWASEGEILDVSLEDVIEPAELVDRLNLVSPLGLRFRGARRLAHGDPGAGRIVRVADYRVALPVRPRDGSELERRLDRFRKGDALSIQDANQERTLFAGEGLLEVTVEDEGTNLFVRVRLDRGAVPRPDDLTAALLDVPCAPTRVTRTALWAVAEHSTLLLSPLDLEELREVHRREVDHRESTVDG
jgi:radical SAM family uncharacterized protein/radical SAM-linked protein